MEVSFPNLTSLEVSNCNSFKYVFTVSMVKCLVQLKKLDISHCELVEEIIQSKKDEEIEQESINAIVFPNLDYLRLKNLPNAKTFSFGYSIGFPLLRELRIETCKAMKNFVSKSSSNKSDDQEEYLFNEMVSFPKLEELEIFHLHSLGMIWKNEFLATGSLEELKVLKVEIKSSVEIGLYIAKLNKLTELHLHGLQFEQLIWNKPLENLKRIYLSQNYSLIRTSDLAYKAPNLEVIVIHCCIRLFEIGSIRNLNKLTQLDIRGCTSISRISEIPGSIKELDLSNSGLSQIPRTIGYLTHLRKLSFEYCKSLESLPSSICSLISLETLNLSKCWSLRKLPYDFGNLEALEELDASYSGLREFPFSIQNLKNLKILNLLGCKELDQFMPTLLPNLQELIR